VDRTNYWARYWHNLLLFGSTIFLFAFYKRRKNDEEQKEIPFNYHQQAIAAITSDLNLGNPLYIAPGSHMNNPIYVDTHGNRDFYATLDLARSNWREKIEIENNNPRPKRSSIEINPIPVSPLTSRNTKRAVALGLPLNTSPSQVKPLPTGRRLV